MKTTNLILPSLFMVSTILFFSFQSNTISKFSYSTTFLIDDSTRVYETVDLEPEFEGGEEAMIRFLQTNLKYPAIAIQKGDQGRVYVRMIVEPNGALSNIEIARGVSPELDDEALRVIKSMPNWNPGQQKGRFVRVSIVVPIYFKLNIEEKKEKPKRSK